jgi:hypothetical protein
MKKVSLPLSLALLFFCASGVAGQSTQREPEIAYIYPAGAQTGTTVRVLVGGQKLRGLKGVRVSGLGVRASVVRYMGRFVRLNRQERKALKEQLTEVRKKLKSQGRKQDDRGRMKKNATGKPDESWKTDPGLTKLLKHPLLSILPALTLEELRFVEYKYLKTDRRLQLNTQLSETVLIEVVVDSDAPPGNRELRLLTGRGLSNSMCFQVGQLPEIRERSPSDPRAGDTEPFELPVVLNGQITPGDTDRFCIRARQGQKLVIQAHARQLVPFLADAVPGWFQATLTLRDGKNREIAYADDYRFDPDPVLFFEIPKTGVYKIEIHDSIYRGRDDFVYRIAISQGPFIKSVFPLGGSRGRKTVVLMDGWNLNTLKLPLDTRPGLGRIRFAVLNQGGMFSNPVAYAVDELLEIDEAEPNDIWAIAQQIDLPAIINGRILKPQDKDLFTFKGRAGDRLVAEVIARRLRSPLDSLLRLKDAAGHVLAWNDDYVYKKGHLHREMGVLTHHSDSYLSATLPTDGVYCIELTDTQGRGGEGYGYRLRLSPPRGDFALRVTPSTINVQPGRAAVIQVHALRKDGFDGEIIVSLRDAPDGFRLEGDVIPHGRDVVRMTLTAPKRRMGAPLRLRVDGWALIDDRLVCREAVASDNVMQAFLWRHLVPSKELIVAVIGRSGRGAVERMGEGPVLIPWGQSARVYMWTPPLPNSKKIEFELSQAPDGITLVDAQILPDRVEFTLKADEKGTSIGFADNLIVHVFTERTLKSAKGAPQKTRRIWIGVLPAIPIRIVKP